MKTHPHADHAFAAVLFLTVTSLCAAATPAPSDADQPISAEDCVPYRGANYDVLYSATLFTGGTTGLFGESTPDEVFALRCMTQEKDAVQRLRTLADKGSPAGQLYALAGLRALDRKEFNCLVPRYESSTETVLTMMGDEGDQVPVAKMADRIATDKNFVVGLLPDLEKKIDQPASAGACAKPSK
jgi:hypothetical protein